MNDSHPGQDRLDAYLLDELDATEREAIGAHLRGCESCRKAVAAMERALAAYRNAGPDEAPARVLDGLLATQGARAPRRIAEARSGFRRPGSLLAASVAAVAIFLSGFWLGQRQPAVATGIATGDTLVALRTSSRRVPPRITFNATAADHLRGVAFRDSSPN